MIDPATWTVPAAALDRAIKVHRLRAAYGEEVCARVSELATTTYRSLDDAITVAIAERMAVAAGEFTKAQAELVTAAGISIESMRAFRRMFSAPIPHLTWRRRPARGRRRKWAKRSR